MSLWIVNFIFNFSQILGINDLYVWLQYQCEANEFVLIRLNCFYYFRVENCRRAMVLAKEQLNVPRVISPEDFASPALDELSSMTYLSYFVRHESPGYYHTLNWACKQLRTTNITNLSVSSGINMFSFIFIYFYV